MGSVPRTNATSTCHTHTDTHAKYSVIIVLSYSKWASSVVLFAVWSDAFY